MKTSLRRRRLLLNGAWAMTGMAYGRPASNEPDLAPFDPQLCGPVVRAAYRVPDARPVLNLNRLVRFVDPLPIPPLARSHSSRPDPDAPSRRIPYYRLEMREFTTRVHRDLGPCRQWGYEGCTPGPTVMTRRGEGLLIEWVNALPRRHLYAIDHTIHGAERRHPDVRTVAHVHGAKVQADSDGFPEAWFVAGQSALYHYANQQEAATLWYHDHAMGITRLNVAAGLVGAYLIHDDTEQALGLPSGKQDIPVMLYDRYVEPDGSLSYPVSGSPQAPWVPEFYGNVVLCNGKLFPYLEVEPRAYRLRFINAANAQFFLLKLSGGATMQQIGTDQGLLSAPLPVNEVQLFPGERAEVVVDFSARAGRELLLECQQQVLMQFRVRSAPAMAARAPLPERLRDVERLREAQSVRTRVLTLGERDDPDGNSTMMLLDGKRWSDPITEKPRLGSVEVWSLVNLTGDVHPVHLHLARFQVLDRRAYDIFAFNADRTLKYQGDPVPALASEAGWKDTVRAEPGMVTRIIVSFDGYAGKYVWHCHLLEHEDMEMMRPYEILS